jgi:hypothetical protein
MTLRQKTAQEIVKISKSIADGYLSKETIIDLIKNSNGRLYISSNGIVDEYSNFEKLEPNEIQGFLTAKIYEDFAHFQNERVYSDFVKNSNYNHKEIFPTMNLRGICVRPTAQNQNIGMKIATCAFQEAYQNDYYPLIGRMWKKSNGHNEHIEKAIDELGATIIGEDESFLKELKCNICGEYDCNCSEVIIIFENIWE